MAKKGGLSSPMNNPYKTPKATTRDTVTYTGPSGPVVNISSDVVSSPGQGQRRASNGQYESVRRVDKP